MVQSLDLRKFIKATNQAVYQQTNKQANQATDKLNVPSSYITQPTDGHNPASI